MCSLFSNTHKRWLNHLLSSPEIELFIFLGLGAAFDFLTGEGEESPPHIASNSSSDESATLFLLSDGK